MVGQIVLYLETLHTEKKQTPMLPVGYVPAILVVNGSMIWYLRLRGHLHITNPTQ
jgi:hypothetical protein